MKNIRIIFMLALIMLFSFWLRAANDREVVESSYKNLPGVMETLDYINKTYVDEEKLKGDKLLYGAIKGMLVTLDPYSAFMDPTEYKEMREESSGNYSGIGVEITVRNDVLTIVSPYEDSPGWKKGLRPGDRILKIDGVSTKNLSSSDAVKKIRGQKGTPVVLTILRENGEKTEDIEIVRDNIRLKSVFYYVNNENLGYIRLSQFLETSDEDVSKAVTEMENKNARGIILDLRNNPGGLLNVSANICDIFLPAEKLIVYTQGRDKNNNRKFVAKAGSKYAENVPVIILVNKGSASASEIVTGALQDNKRAVIMGSKTFGKGSVQSIYSLSDGSGLRLTTAYYYTPSGKKIHEKGIEPDITAEDTIFPEVVYKLAYQEHFANYARQYVKNNPKLEITAKFTVDDKTVEEFAREVRTKGFTISDIEVTANKEMLKKQLKIEMVRALLGEDAAKKEITEQDETVKKAEDLIKVSEVFRANGK